MTPRDARIAPQQKYPAAALAMSVRVEHAISRVAGQFRAVSHRI
jgi:hypothetical protein